MSSRIHIVFASEPGTDVEVESILNWTTAASQFVSPDQVHLLTAESSRFADTELNVIDEPLCRGNAPAIAYAGCHLYLLDPTAMMVVVPANEEAFAALQDNFSALTEAAEAPGSLVSLSEREQATGLYAWSVYALMETFRNYCPVDFPIINEMVRSWNGEPETKRELYDKLVCEDIEQRLLDKLIPGYPTRRVTVESAAPMVV